MRNLFCATVLGLLALVQSTPLNTVTQDEVYREAMTDGYLVDLRFLASLTTRSARRNATVWGALQPASVPKHSGVTEGSGESSDTTTDSSSPQGAGEDHATKLWTGSHRPVTPIDSDESGSEGSGFGQEETPVTHSGRPTSTTETSTTPSTSTAVITEMSPPPLGPSEGPGSESRSGSGSESGSKPGFINKETSTNLSVMVQPPDVNEQKKDQIKDNTRRTPGWVIIVALVVCVAALLIVWVVIAKRDKRNRPNQASQLPTKADQQGELEKEAFLYKCRPTENGKPGDYTVIALHELPEKYSSH